MIVAQVYSAVRGRSIQLAIIVSFYILNLSPLKAKWRVSFVNLIFRFIFLFVIDFWFFTARGCAAAAVRVWKRLDEPPVEICGEKLKEEHETFISDGNAMKIT